MENKCKYNFQKLWHILLDKGMTKRELAKQSGVSMSSLSRMKQGRAISYEKMQSICRVVGKEDVKDIMEEESFLE